MKFIDGLREAFLCSHSRLHDRINNNIITLVIFQMLRSAINIKSIQKIIAF